MVMVAVMIAVAEGLFDVGGVDCGEASDSVRFTAQPHRHPPSSITNRINLAVSIEGTAYVPPRPLDSASVPLSCTAKRASTALRRRWVKLTRN